jgi:hypothetical protein
MELMQKLSASALNSCVIVIFFSTFVADTRGAFNGILAV